MALMGAHAYYSIDKIRINTLSLQTGVWNDGIGSCGCPGQRHRVVSIRSEGSHIHATRGRHQQGQGRTTRPANHKRSSNKVSKETTRKPVSFMQSWNRISRFKSHLLLIWNFQMTLETRCAIWNFWTFWNFLKPFETWNYLNFSNPKPNE